MDEIQFPTLVKVLKQFADDTGNNYAAVLESNGHPTTQRTLENAAQDPNKHKVTARVGGYDVTFDLPSYWKYIEHGTRPHLPPYSAIRQWIDIKPVIPRPGKNGKLPTPSQLAYAIRAKIAKVGTKGTEDLALARDVALAGWMQRIKDALIADATVALKDALIGPFVIKGRL